MGSTNSLQAANKHARLAPSALAASAFAKASTFAKATADKTADTVVAGILNVRLKEIYG
jgi:hypothetical protein